MKLLTGTHYFDTHTGGVEIVAGELARALAVHEKMTVTWMACDATDPPHDFPGATLALNCWNVAERRFGFPLPVPSIGALGRIRDAVRRCDAVLLHDALYPTNVAAARFARGYSKPLVVVQHVGLVPYSSALLRTMMRVGNESVAARMLRGADQVVFISGLTQRYFSKLTTFRRPPKLIFNGVRTDLPGLQSAPARADARQMLGVRSDRFAVLFVGRFVEKKGLGVIRSLADNFPDVEWLMCGWGPIDPTRWATPNVRVLGAVDSPRLAAAYRAADVLMLPSVGEGLPLVVQEALASGLGVIGSDELLVADAWLGGKIITAPVDPAKPDVTVAAWSRALQDFRAGAGTSSELAAQARSRYSWRSSAAAYGGILRGLARRPAP